MARTANSVASLLLYALMPGWASDRHHAPGSHRYAAGLRPSSSADTDQAGAGEVGWPGWFCGQSGARSAGGLMMAQLANDMVRDQRNIPVLLVMLNWPKSTKNQSM